MDLIQKPCLELNAIGASCPGRRWKCLAVHELYPGEWGLPGPSDPSTHAKPVQIRSEFQYVVVHAWACRGHGRTRQTGSKSFPGPEQGYPRRIQRPNKTPYHKNQCVQTANPAHPSGPRTFAAFPSAQMVHENLKFGYENPTAWLKTPSILSWGQLPSES